MGVWGVISPDFTRGHSKELLDFTHKSMFSWKDTNVEVREAALLPRTYLLQHLGCDPCPGFRWSVRWSDLGPAARHVKIS